MNTKRNWEYTDHVIIGLTSLVEAKDLVIHHGMDIVGLDGPDHIPHQCLATHIDTTDCADVAQSLKDTRLSLRAHTTEETNDADDTLELDALEGLLEGTRTADLDDIVHTGTIGGQ